MRCRENSKAAIIHPGAVGDCALSLPLADFFKNVIGVEQVDMIARADYTHFYPQRTGVDRVRPMEALPLHRLFADSSAFEPEQKDSLIQAFSEYEYIVSFLGAGNRDYEQNLIFAAYCTHSAQVCFIEAAGTNQAHIAEFYLNRLAQQLGLEEPADFSIAQKRITPLATDFQAGKDCLAGFGLDADKPLVLIQPGSGGKEKCWAMENFLQVGNRLKQNGFQAGFLLGPVEEERMTLGQIGQIKDAGAVVRGLNLLGVVQVLSCSDIFLGNDSGISHLAGAMGLKTAAVFGPSEPQMYRPLGPNVETFQIPGERFATACPWDQEMVFDVLSKWM